MRKSKVMLLGCVLACVAILGLASSASAQVLAGVVGGGIHMQYGPQNAGGDYLGVASGSYDALLDWETGFWDFAGPHTTESGQTTGYVLMAFDPYTGEVWTRVPDEHQGLLNPGWGGAGGYPHLIGLTDVDGVGDPISSDVALADMGRGYTDNTIFITSVWRDIRPDFIWGMLIATSPDGGLLSATTGDTPEFPGFGERALMSFGDEVRPYAAGLGLPVWECTSRRADPTVAAQAQDFALTETIAYAEHWYDPPSPGVYDFHHGENGLFGFEMDGIRGWMQLDCVIPGGVRLTEYYFDLLAGDFDGDGDVDADDINLLCANMGGDPATYDLDGDLDVDEDDMTFLVENLAEWDNGVDTGVGTMQGDFNLDGVVNATDLAIMKATFGASGIGYADGNANCDDVVNATDLAILKSTFGQTATPGGGVPEPMTIGLLALGGLALLRRKSKIRRGGTS